MTQLIVEGFATYGLGTASQVSRLDISQAMKSGAWADVATSMGFTLAAPPWSNDNAIYLQQRTTQKGSADYETRRVIPGGTRDELIVSMRCAVAQLPSVAHINGLLSFRTASNANICRIVVQPTGILTVNSGSPITTVLASTQTPVMVAESPVHMEVKAKVSTGSVVIYVDGAKVLDATGLALGSDPVGMFVLAATDTAGYPPDIMMLFTDLIVRDTAGSYNNTIMGDRRVATIMVNNDDLAHQGWTPHPLQRFGNAILANIIEGSTSSCVYCSASTQTNLGSGDFTIEGQFRFASLPTGSNIATLFAKWSDSDNNRSYRLYKGGPLLDSGLLTFQISTDGTNGGVVTVLTWPWNPETGVWYHVALCRKGGQTRLFINGVMQGLAVADANTYFASTTARTAVLGQVNGSTFATAVNNTRLPGWSDEFRITVGVGRYDTNFTPPSAAFPRNIGGDPSWASVMWLSGWENGLFDDSSIGRSLFDIPGSSSPRPGSVTPGDLGNNYKLLNKRAPPLDNNFISADFIPATGLFTLTGLPADGETVRLGTKDGTNAATYRWKTALAAAYDVLIGGTADACAVNLAAAINKDAGEGTIYGTGTVANFDAVATKMPTTQILASALISGTVGNAIVTTDTTANGSWGSGTLTGGADIPSYSQFGLERPPNNTTVIDSVTLVSRAWKTDSGPASLVQSLVGPAGAVADGATHTMSTSGTLYFDTFEVDPDTSAPLTPTTIVGGKVRVNRTV